MPLRKKLKSWLAHKLPTCKEVTRMASDALDRKLPLLQQIKMRLHFLTCNLCLRYFRQLEFLRDLAHLHEAHTEETNPSANTSLPAATRERFKRMLKDSSPE